MDEFSNVCVWYDVSMFCMEIKTERKWILPKTDRKCSKKHLENLERQKVISSKAHTWINIGIRRREMTKNQLLC